MATGKWTAEQIPSQAGRTALVTGANSGIGYQTALELARHGAHVLLGCRNEAKGLAALERLREARGIRGRARRWWSWIWRRWRRSARLLRRSVRAGLRWIC